MEDTLSSRKDLRSLCATLWLKFINRTARTDDKYKIIKGEWNNDELTAVDRQDTSGSWT